MRAAPSECPSHVLHRHLPNKFSQRSLHLSIAYWALIANKAIMVNTSISLRRTNEVFSVMLRETSDGKNPMIVILRLVILLICAGCTSAPIEVSPGAVIYNRQQKEIKTLAFRPCGTSGTWVKINGSNIASGLSFVFQLPDDCVDLQARSDDGKVVGTQYDIKRQYPFRWDLY